MMEKICAICGCELVRIQGRLTAAWRASVNRMIRERCHGESPLNTTDRNPQIGGFGDAAGDKEARRSARPETIA